MASSKFPFEQFEQNPFEQFEQFEQGTELLDAENLLGRWEDNKRELIIAENHSGSINPNGP